MQRPTLAAIVGAAAVAVCLLVSAGTFRGDVGALAVSGAPVGADTGCLLFRCPGAAPVSGDVRRNRADDGSLVVTAVYKSTGVLMRSVATLSATDLSVKEAFDLVYVRGGYLGVRTKRSGTSISLEMLGSGRMTVEKKTLRAASEHVYHFPTLPYVMAIAAREGMPRKIVTLSPLAERVMVSDLSVTGQPMAQAALSNAYETVQAHYAPGDGRLMPRVVGLQIPTRGQVELEVVDE